MSHSDDTTPILAESLIEEGNQEIEEAKERSNDEQQSLSSSSHLPTKELKENISEDSTVKEDSLTSTEVEQSSSLKEKSSIDILPVLHESSSEEVYEKNENCKEEQEEVHVKGKETYPNVIEEFSNLPTYEEIETNESSKTKNTDFQDVTTCQILKSKENENQEKKAPKTRTDCNEKLNDQKETPVQQNISEPKGNTPITAVNKTTILEPGLFLIMLGMASLMTTSQNLILFKICHNQFGYDENFCLSNMSDNSSITSKVQKIASDYTLYRSLIETLPSIACAIVFGAWSDKHGRKIPMVLSATGFLLSAITTSIVGSLETPAYYLLISPLVSAIGGGMSSLFMASFSMISDVTTPEKRSLRIAIVDLCLFGAIPLGTMVSGLLFGNYGFRPVFWMSCTTSFLGLLYIIVFVKETVVTPIGDERKKMWIDLFDINNFKNSLSVTFKKREGKTRTYIILLMCTIILLVMPFIGESSCTFLYTQKKFQWTQTDYSYYSATRSVIGIFGLLIAMPIAIKILNMSDPLMAFIGNTARFLNSILIPFITVSWGLYAASSLEFFAPLCMPTIRSQISKLVDPGELGKVFSVIAAAEATVPLFSGALYSQLYKQTVDNFSGSVFFLSAGLIVIPTLIFVFLHLNMKKPVPYQRLTEDNDEEKYVASGSGTNNSANTCKY